MNQEKELLEVAAIELHFAEQLRFSHCQGKAIDWGEINGKLKRIDLALEQNDSVSFKENYFNLIKKLSHKNETLREYARETEDPRQLAPQDTRELLNHIVDRIIKKLEAVPAPLRTPAENLKPNLQNKVAQKSLR